METDEYFSFAEDEHMVESPLTDLFFWRVCGSVAYSVVMAPVGRIKPPAILCP
jgi:hypothetical protein